MRNFLDKIIPDNIDKEVGNFLLFCWTMFPIYLVLGFFDSRIFMVYFLGTACSTIFLTFACLMKDEIKNKSSDDDDWIFLIFTFLMGIVIIVLLTIEFVLK